jgi:hypothetical protein
MQIFQPSGSLLTPRVQELVGEILAETSRDDKTPIEDYIEMIQTSPIVGPAVELKVLLGLRYFESYANGEPDYQDFIRKCFERMNGSLKLSVAELMCVSPLGFACSEWAPIEREGQWMLDAIQIIDPRKYRFRGKRGQIEDLLYAGEFGDIAVPYERVIHLTNQSFISFGNPYGVAECKRAIAAYKGWKITIAAALIASKRRGEPILAGFADSQQQVQVGTDQDGQPINIPAPQALLQSMQQLENNSVLATDLANRIEDLQAADGKIILDVLKVLQVYQLLAFLVPESVLMASGVGDSNLNTGHRTLLDLCVGSVAEQIKERLIEDVVRPLLTWEFGEEVEDFGEFPSPKEQPEGAIDLFNALISAVYNGAFSAADLDVINRMRELAGLPTVTEILQPVSNAPTGTAVDEGEDTGGDISAEAVQFAKAAPKGKGKKKGGKGQKNCEKGVNCGGTCISAKKKCKVDSPSEKVKAKSKSVKGGKPSKKGGGGSGETPAYKIPTTGKDSVDAQPVFGVETNGFIFMEELEEITGLTVTRTATSALVADIADIKDLPLAAQVADGKVLVGVAPARPSIAPGLEKVGGIKHETNGQDVYYFVAENGKLRTLDKTESALLGSASKRWEYHNAAIAQTMAMAGGNEIAKRKAAPLHIETTNKLWSLEDNVLGRKPPKVDRVKLEADVKSEAVAWAKQMGFDGDGVNGFSADATKAHDVAHPATHRLAGLSSKQIHESFGSLKTKDGKPSLLAEEALVNAVEHLSRGDSKEASIQNALRLAKVLSRDGTEEEQAYVRSPEFARGVIDVVNNRIYKNDQYSNLMPIVRDSNIISGTVRTSGTDFNDSASGG